MLCVICCMHSATCFFFFFQIFDMLLNGDIYPYPTFYFNVTGVTNYDNILRQEVC